MPNKRGRSNNGPPFIRLFRVVKRSRAYHELSVYARGALIELMDRYNGVNNGFIGLGVRELAYELNCSQATAGRALRELDDAHLAQPTTLGSWRGKKATEWRLMFYRCDLTGELPNRNFKPRQSFISEAQSVSSKAQAHSKSHRKSANAKKPNKQPSAKSQRESTYRSIPGGVGEGASAPQAMGLPRLPAFLDRRGQNTGDTA